MNFNPIFISNIRDIFGKFGEEGLKNISSQLSTVCEKLNLRFIEIFPNLTYHFVGLVEILANGEMAVIKMAPDNNVLEKEAHCLECFSRGSAKIYAFDEGHHTILMERLQPGNSLKSLVRNGDDELATRIIAQTILELQFQQNPKYTFKHLSELGKTLKILKNHVDNRLLSKAQTWFRELSSDRSQDVILHGDLHHDNILASGSVWKAIDPHGYVGDPTFEVGSMIFNPYDAFPEDRPLHTIIERRLKILGEELPFDPQKIQAWAFCRTMLSAAWTFEDHNKVDEGDMEIAKIIGGIKL